MKNLLSSLLLFCCLTAFSKEFRKTVISPQLEVYQLSQHTFVHVSTIVSEQYGRFSSNGVLLVNQNKAWLFDTPPTDSLTMLLHNWIRDTLKAELAACIPNHWHVDCMGGLAYLNSKHIPSYANIKTIEIARKQGLPVPEHGFKDSLTLDVDGMKICCIFPGEAHATDNIAIWLPDEKILFPGCIVKELASPNLGNTKDGNTATYPAALEFLLKKFPDAAIVIPGHGKWGDISLLRHTLKLAGTK